MSSFVDTVASLVKAAGSRLRPRLRGPGGLGRLHDLARVATGGHGAVDAFAGTPCAAEPRAGEDQEREAGGAAGGREPGD